MTRPKALIAWSSGKDSAWALHEVRRTGDYDIIGALTTVTDEFARVSMHGVREELLRAQLDAAGLPARILRIPYPCPNEVYERAMATAIAEAKAEGVTHMIFGDLFLQDIRDYRERQLLGTGLEPLFPVWEIPTAQLARDMIAAGVKAKITCVDPAQVDRTFAGRDFDQALLDSLPSGVDPCGENGEFHTFVYDAPVFSSPIDVRMGEIVERDGFVFADVLPEK
jgi:uncharacterized protein (TIGR00290 family)